MGIETTPVHYVKEDYRCDSCSKGYYRPTGVMLTSSPPQFPHVCTECGHRKTFMEQYPRVVMIGERNAAD